jgi:hypothetical protein
MTNYAGFRKSTDIIDWIRSAPGQYFLKQIDERVEAAHENLLATCSKSTDPKVTAAATLWNELTTLAAFFRNAHKDRVDE